MKQKLLLRFLFIMLATFCLTESGYAQYNIRGKITSYKDGETVPGASVMIKGTSLGTLTNEDGVFSLSAPNGNGILVVSFIGFKTQELQVDNRVILDIVLKEDATVLGEVLVTALNIEREKKALGYSIQSVDMTSATEAREANVANSLKGKIAGVHVNPTTGGAGSSSFVVIRGGSSLAGENQPLYVVDGVPIDNQTLDRASLGGGKDYGDGINNINPDDIESMSVLKGPAGASLYGARGANGVILITTKSGKGRKGIGLEFNSNAVLEKINVIPTMQSKWGVGYGGNNGFGSALYDGVKYPAHTGNGDFFGGALDGQMIMYTYMPEWGPKEYSAQPADNIKGFYNTGKTFTNSVAISGGGDNSTFRASVSDMRNTGILPNYKFERQTINLRATSNITEKLYVEGKVNYVKQKTNNRQMNGIALKNPNYSLILVPRFVDLNWLKDYKKADGSAANWRSGVPYNPYWIVNEFQGEDTRDRIIGMLLARYKITSWLSLQGRAGTDFYTDQRFEREGTGTPVAASLSGTVGTTRWTVKEENIDVLLTANSKLSDNFTGSFSLGANHLDRKQEVVGYSGQNLNIPYFYHINNAQLITARNSVSKKQMNSVYFTGNLGFKDYLFLDITGRNDWSSTLGINNNSFFYPSVATSFVFTEALKIPSNPILSFGKIRVSLAQAGNDASPYQTVGGYALGTVGYGPGLPYATVQSRVPLSTLKNELTTGFEVGTEFRFLKNRLGLDFTFYSQSTKNQILPVQVSMATGYSTRVINAGEIRNKGLELMLNGSLIQGKKFKWEMNLNLSQNKSRVISLAPNITSYVMESTSSNAYIEARVGEAYGNIVGFPYLRTDDGRLLLGSNGTVQRSAERIVLGNIQPDFLGGITNTFSFRGLTLSGLLDIRQGGNVFSFTKAQQMGKGTGVFTEDRENMINDGVIKQSDGSFKQSDLVLLPEEYYAQRYWGNVGEEFVLDASYISLREMTFGYAFRPAFLKKTPFRSMKFSVVGRNLAYLKRDPQMKAMGITPESAYSPSMAAQGFEANTAPSTRTYGFNLAFSL